MSTALVPTRKADLEPVREEEHLRPPVDIYENDDELLVVTDMPGVDRTTLEVQAQHGELRIRGQQEKLERVPRHRSRRFERAFTLPASVDPDRCSAELKTGVLHVHLPKAEGARRHRIEVKSA